MKDSIDFSLIWKYTNASISDSEMDELNQWLESDEKHRIYFEKVVKYSENKTNLAENDGYKNPISPQFSESDSKSFKRKILRLSRVAAIFVLFLIAGYGVFSLFINNKKELDLTEISFDPGIQKATLVLNNGEKLELESAKDTLLHQKETVIHNTASKLQYQSVPSQKPEPDAQTTEYNTLLVPRGGEYLLVLSDKTRVHLNSESVLKFPVSFSGNVREVQLIGEAFFEVQPDSNRPFIVNTGAIVTKVFGTSFNINSYPDKDVIATTLVDGKVSLIQYGQTTTEIQLNPGEQGFCTKSGGVIQKKEVDIMEYTAWKDGRFVFRNKSLEEITNTLGRWYNVNFVFQNPNIRNIHFTGNLKRYDNIQSILLKISKTNEIKFTAYENTIYLN